MINHLVSLVSTCKFIYSETVKAENVTTIKNETCRFCVRSRKFLDFSFNDVYLLSQLGKRLLKSLEIQLHHQKTRHTHTKEVSTSFLQAHSHYDEEGEKWEKNEKVVNYLNLNCNRKTFLFVDQKWDLMCYILLVELARETGLLATGFKVKLFVSLINHYVPTTATFVNS